MRRKTIGMLSMIYETVLMRCIQDYVRPSAASSISSRALKPVLPREGEESKERRRPFVASSGASLWPLADCTGWTSRQGSRAMRPSSFLALTTQESPFLSLMRRLTRPTKCQYSRKLQQNFTGPLRCADLTSAPWGPTDTQLYNMPQPR